MATKWGIFKCQNCGKRFKEKLEPRWLGNKKLEYEVERIGTYTSTVSTHSCKPRVYGSGVLIGAELRMRKAAPAEPQRDTGNAGEGQG
jgi:hypothetical protein